MSPYQRIKEQLWEENQNIVNIHFLLGNLGRGQGFLIRMKWDHLQGMHIKQMGHTGLPVPLVLQGRGQDMEQLMGILEMQSGKKDIKKNTPGGLEFHRKFRKNYSSEPGFIFVFIPIFMPICIYNFICICVFTYN